VVRESLYKSIFCPSRTTKFFQVVLEPKKFGNHSPRTSCFYLNGSSLKNNSTSKNFHDNILSKLFPYNQVDLKVTLCQNVSTELHFTYLLTSIKATMEHAIYTVHDQYCLSSKRKGSKKVYRVIFYMFDA